MRNHDALVPEEKRINIGDLRHKQLLPGDHLIVVTAKGERRPYKITEVWMANQEFLKAEAKNPQIACFSTKEDITAFLSHHPNLPLKHHYNVWMVLEGAGPRLLLFIYEILDALESGNVFNPHKVPNL